MFHLYLEFVCAYLFIATCSTFLFNVHSRVLLNLKKHPFKEYKSTLKDPKLTYNRELSSINNGNS